MKFNAYSNGMKGILLRNTASHLGCNFQRRKEKGVKWSREEKVNSNDLLKGKMMMMMTTTVMMMTTVMMTHLLIAL